MSIAAPFGIAHAPAPRLQTPRLRITARGRKVLAAVITVPAVTALTAIALLSGGSAIATGNAGTADFDYLTVQAGQSLWGIAESIAPEADPRDVIAEIMSLNQLRESSVQAGQRIAIPADLGE